MSQKQNLLEAVEAFLVETGMPLTRFGEMAVNEKNFVKGLRKGRRCWPETEAKVRHFIKTGETAHEPSRRTKAALADLREAS